MPAVGHIAIEGRTFLVRVNPSWPSTFLCQCTGTCSLCTCELLARKISQKFLFSQLIFYAAKIIFFLVLAPAAWSYRMKCRSESIRALKRDHGIWHRSYVSSEGCASDNDLIILAWFKCGKIAITVWTLRKECDVIAEDLQWIFLVFLRNKCMKLSQAHHNSLVAMEEKRW